MNEESIKYQKKVSNPLLFKIGMLVRLPSVLFWGIAMKEITEEKCTVTIPFSWRTQNPFKSIYFAALAGAAELSTGALCQMQLAGRVPHSMLVIDFRAEYYKKADSKISYTCTQGLELAALLDSLTKSGDTGQLMMVTEGRNNDGVIVSKVFVTWSFKRKG